MEPTNLSTAFTVWAAIVGLVGVAIVYELARLRNEVNLVSLKLTEAILSQERRLTAIETHLVMQGRTRTIHEFTPIPPTVSSVYDR